MNSGTSPIRGVITAMVTPFDERGDVDIPAARRLARHLIESGSHGLVSAGTTGECPTIADPEQIELLRAVVDEVGGEATIIAGSGTNDTAHSVELTEAVTEAGADAVLVVAPYYNKPNRAGLKAHYRAVSRATHLPVVLYNIPARTAVNMDAELLAEIAAENDNVVAVKQANNDELAPVEGLDLIAGNDNVFFRTLELGGVGGILVSSHIVGPEMRELYDAATGGDLDRAREIDERLRPIYDATTVTSNPIPIKAALEMLGICSARVRLPLVEADAEQREAIRAALEGHGLLAAKAA